MYLRGEQSAVVIAEYVWYTDSIANAIAVLSQANASECVDQNLPPSSYLVMQHIDDASGIRHAASAFLATAVKKLEAGDALWLMGPSPLCTPPLAFKFVTESNDNIDAND
jgi:hypothetical protein